MSYRFGVKEKDFPLSNYKLNCSCKVSLKKDPRWILNKFNILIIFVILGFILSFIVIDAGISVYY